MRKLKRVPKGGGEGRENSDINSFLGGTCWLVWRAGQKGQSHAAGGRVLTDEKVLVGGS